MSLKPWRISNWKLSICQKLSHWYISDLFPWEPVLICMGSCEHNICQYNFVYCDLGCKLPSDYFMSADKVNSWQKGVPNFTRRCRPCTVHTYTCFFSPFFCCTGCGFLKANLLSAPSALILHAWCWLLSHRLSIYFLTSTFLPAVRAQNQSRSCTVLTPAEIHWGSLARSAGNHFSLLRPQQPSLASSSHPFLQRHWLWKLAGKPPSCSACFWRRFGRSWTWQIACSETGGTWSGTSLVPWRTPRPGSFPSPGGCSCCGCCQAGGTEGQWGWGRHHRGQHQWQSPGGAVSWRSVPCARSRAGCSQGSRSEHISAAQSRWISARPRASRTIRLRSLHRSESRWTRRPIFPDFAGEKPPVSSEAAFELSLPSSCKQSLSPSRWCTRMGRQPAPGARNNRSHSQVTALRISRRETKPNKVKAEILQSALGISKKLVNIAKIVHQMGFYHISWYLPHEGRKKYSLNIRKQRLSIQSSVMNPK